MHRVILWSALVVALGCASQPEYFRPTERAVGTAPTGEPESVYDVVVAGTRYGEVKVWSAGAYRGAVEGRERTLVHVAIDVENASDVALRLDPRAIRLEAIKLNDVVLPDAPMVSTAGSMQIPPKSAGGFEAYFELPEGTDPQNVDAFQVRWSLAADGELYSQITPFTEFSPPRYYYGYAPGYYYPYYRYGYYYDWSFHYPYHHHHAIVRHHVPHHVGVPRHVLERPHHFPHRVLPPHHVIRPHHAPHIRHHGFAPSHHHHRRY